jgi:4-aminobutyrate aminotransferase
VLSPLLTQATGVVAVRGEGAYLYGPDGERYLDLTSGIGVTSTGHCHPRVVAAAQAQTATLIHGQYTTVLHPPLVELSERLESVMPAGIDSFFYASAGTEAVEASLRLVRQATGRPNVVVFQGGFHGRTMASLSMTTSKTALRAGLQPLMPGVVVAPFPDAFRYGWDEDETVRFCLRELDHLLATQTAPDETAAVYLEPVLGEGGYVPVPPAFARGLRQRCDAHGMLLVADEIQTGVGRTGRFWGHDHFGVAPDVVISAKGLASGFPLSVAGAPRELMVRGRPGSQGGTYGGNAVACAAALATLDVVEEEGLVERAAARGEQLLAGLRAAVGDHAAVGDLRGRGLMVGVELVDGEGRPDGDLASAVLRHASDLGLLLLPCGAYGQVVRFIPPLVVSEEQVDDGIALFADALNKAAVGR